MAVVPKALCCFLVSVICMELAEGQSIPDRCLCPSTSKFHPYKFIDEFVVIQKRAGCSTKEIILTLKNGNPETEKREQRCLNTETKQASIFLSCWERKNKDGSRPTIKVSECIMHKTPVKESESSGSESSTGERSVETPGILKAGIPAVL